MADQDPSEQVRVLTAGLGLSASLFPLPMEVAADARAGQTVAAVRGLRAHAAGRVSLVAAKRMVDALASAASATSCRAGGG